MKHVPDEDLIDHWLVYSSEGTIEVTEAEARAVLKAQAEATMELRDLTTAVLVNVIIRPTMYELTDLFGAESHIRLDHIYLVSHFSPEWREAKRRYDKLVENEGDAFE